MTIFEMLEKLETEIVSLQTRYQDLAKSAKHPAVRSNGHSAEKSRPARRAAKKKAGKKRVAKKPDQSAKPPEFAQLELPVDEPATPVESQQGRVLGKRQALGKSLLQLRKMSAWRNARASEE